MIRRVRPVAWVAGLLLIGLALAAWTADGLGPLPGWWPYRHEQLPPLVDGGRPTLNLIPFSSDFGLGPHPLGQLQTGQDFLAIVLRGLRRSLIVCLVATGVALVIGVGVGVLSGYLRGWVDAALTRVTELAFIVPAVVIAAVLGRFSARLADGWAVDPAVLLGVVIGAMTWMTLARVVRAQTLHLRTSGFVRASAALGAGPGFIIGRHIIAHLSGPVLAATALVAGNAVLLESALSYLGFGVQRPDTSLGLLVDEYGNTATTRPWLLLPPGLGILILVLAVHALAEGLAPLADPRTPARLRPRIWTTLAGRRPGARTPHRRRDRSGGAGR